MEYLISGSITFYGGKIILKNIFFEKINSEDVVNSINGESIQSVLDIGSNDGTLLKFFKKKGLNVLGVEPAQQIASIANNSGINTIADYFNKETAELILKTYGLLEIA